MEEVNFTKRSTPLPPLSFQELRPYFDDSISDKSKITKIMAIPYHFDLLSKKGISEWRAQRRNFIEQDNVSTFHDESFVHPDALRRSFRTQQVDQFQEIDDKLNQIARSARKMEQDYDELNIPQPNEVPSVGQMFPKTVRHETRVTFDDDPNSNVEIPVKAATIRTQQDEKISKAIYRGENQAEKKVQLARKIYETERTQDIYIPQPRYEFNETTQRQSSTPTVRRKPDYEKIARYLESNTDF